MFPLEIHPRKKQSAPKKKSKKGKKRTRCVQNRARRARKASADNLPVARYHQLSTPLVSIFTFRIEVQTRLKEKSFRSSGKFFRFSYNFRLALTAQLFEDKCLILSTMFHFSNKSATIKDNFFLFSFYFMVLQFLILVFCNNF